MVPQDTRTFGAGWGSNAPALTTPGLFIWPCCSPVFSSLFLRVSVKLRSSPGAGATWFSQALSSAALKGGQAGQKSTPSGSSPLPPPALHLPSPGCASWARAWDPQGVRRWLVLRDPLRVPPSPSQRQTNLFHQSIPSEDALLWCLLLGLSNHPSQILY